MLKSGVHLLGIEDDDESGKIMQLSILFTLMTHEIFWFPPNRFSTDASDWQGFSRKDSDEL